MGNNGLVHPLVCCKVLRASPGMHGICQDGIGFVDVQDEEVLGVAAGYSEELAW